jgi:hypothetical protein
VLEAAGTHAIHVRAEFYSKPHDPSRRAGTQLSDMAVFPETPYPLGDVVDDSRHGAGSRVPLAAVVKKAMAIPIVTIGRLDVELGEEVLGSGKADFISFNRILMADPELANCHSNLMLQGEPHWDGTSYEIECAMCGAGGSVKVENGKTKSVVSKDGLTHCRMFTEGRYNHLLETTETHKRAFQNIETIRSLSKR